MSSDLLDNLHVFLQLIGIIFRCSALPKCPVQEALQPFPPNVLRIRAPEPAGEEVIRIVNLSADLLDELFSLLARAERWVYGFALQVAAVPEEEEVEDGFCCGPGLQAWKGKTGN